MDTQRWLVEIDYRLAHGVHTERTSVEELEQLQGLVEHGPDWNTLVQIRVTLNPARRAAVNEGAA